MNDPHSITIGAALSGFLDYLAAERRFSPATVKKYGENVAWFVREIGDLPIAALSLQHFFTLKARIGERGAKEARIASMVAALKSLLSYARDVLGVPVLDLTKVKAPRRVRREVVYLSKEELEQFVAGIPLRTWMGQPRLPGYRFRAVVETLIATAMRISEVLSLNRDSIDFVEKQAKIIGKGNRERVVFFTDRALTWINRYLELRRDRGPALFASPAGERLKPNSVEAAFKRHAQWTGMTKPVTPHIIRHTAATHLLQNGCPIGFIKEILGHERLETTCRFYLGILNKADTKKAHQLYANLDPDKPIGSHFASPAQPEDSAKPPHRPLTDPSAPLQWRYQP